MPTHLCYYIVVKVKVYAKLNLTLAVGTRQGAFHPIDSTVTSVDVYDTVEAVPCDDVTVQCDMPVENNSAYRAAVAFRREFETSGVSVTIEKGIPMGAGLGGSSADAAATVYCMCALFGIDPYSPRVHELCASLGSDVNFMLRGGYARMRGKGDDLEYSELEHRLYFALTQFDRQLSAAQVYAEFDRREGRSELPVYPEGVLSPFEFFAGDLSRLSAEQVPVTRSLMDAMWQGGLVGSQCFNDLQYSAQCLSGYARRYLRLADKRGYHCTMTGSGSAYFILFDNEAQAVQAAALLNGKGFTTRVCRSVPCGIEKVG